MRLFMIILLVSTIIVAGCTTQASQVVNTPPITVQTSSPQATTTDNTQTVNTTLNTTPDYTNIQSSTDDFNNIDDALKYV